jgi:ATP-dependent DNA helicase RecG
MGKKTPNGYRNPWLVSAMETLGMIDRNGYGIGSMFISQRERYFPLPEYDLSETNHVYLTIYGKEIDENYSKILIERENLTLDEVVLLDNVQKKKTIKDEAAKLLRKEGLIEGRKPNYFLSMRIAQSIGKKAEYSRNKGMDKQYYLDFIMKAIDDHKSLERKDIDKLLWEKLPEYMDEEKKKNKIRNLLAELRRSGKIENIGTDTKPIWVLTTGII